MNGGILCLDLATTMGWCEGLPGEKPASGTIRLAPEGSKPAAIGGGLLDWLATRLTTFRYRMIVYEAPMDPRHMKTNINTARLLLGLPMVVEAVAYQTGHYGLREVSVNDVRKHLLGFIPRRQKGERGDGPKQAVISGLRGRGFDPADDNEADAIAAWIFVTDTIAGRN